MLFGEPDDLGGDQLGAKDIAASLSERKNQALGQPAGSVAAALANARTFGKAGRRQADRMTGAAFNGVEMAVSPSQGAMHLLRELENR